MIKMKEISERFKEMSEMLLECRSKGKKCRWCLKKNKCMELMRATLGAVCMMFIDEDTIEDECINTMFS